MSPSVLVALVLAGAPHLAQDELALLSRSVPPLVGPLAVLSSPLERARVHGAPPSVEAVREHLAAVRTLEEKARAAMASALAPSERATLHQLLGLAWAEVANLEEALAIEGQGEGPERNAVRAQARLRSEDAWQLSASELFDAASEPQGALPGPVHALGLRLGRGLRQRASASDVARSRGGELQACWEEHLLTQGAEEPLPLVVTLELEAGRVVGVSFQPALTKQRVHLGACLSTRLLAWRVTDDADALELPVHLGSSSARE